MVKQSLCFLGKVNVSVKKMSTLSLEIRDQSICYLTSYKYLGITLDPLLTLSHHLLDTYIPISIYFSSEINATI